MVTRFNGPSSAFIEPFEPRVLLSAGGMKHAPPPTPAAAHEVRVYEPHARVRGQTQAEWSERWWQWALSHTVDESPFFGDESDPGYAAKARLGDVGKVFFLTGVINQTGSAERSIEVPTGTPIFFPVLNVECSELENNVSTFEELDACTEGSIDLVSELHVTIDGEPLEDVAGYRQESGLFTITMPEEGQNILQFFGADAPPGASSPAVSDGFWVMLKPLPPGEHMINFGGTFGPVDAPLFQLDITYHLTVRPKGAYAKAAPTTIAGESPFRAGGPVRDSVLGGVVGGDLF